MLTIMMIMMLIGMMIIIMKIMIVVIILIPKSQDLVRRKPQPRRPQLQQPRPKQPRRRLLSRFCFFIFFIVEVEFLVLMTQQHLSRFVDIDCKC